MAWIVICFMYCVFVALIAALVFFLYLFNECTKPENDSEFPTVGTLVDPNNRHWFRNLDTFKKIVYYFAEKDEEIKNYLLSRKSRHDSNAARIPDSDVGRETAGMDVPSDI